MKEDVKKSFFRKPASWRITFFTDNFQGFKVNK